MHTNYLKLTLLLTPILAFVSLSGCARSEDAANDQVRVAYIINGSLGDLSFYDSGQTGIDRIAERYGAQTTTIETNYDPAKYPQALQSALQWNADVIFVISYGFEDLVQEFADANPEVTVVNVDTVVTNSANTITSVDFIEEEGAFMAGAAAALATTDRSIQGINDRKLIGAVGGDKDPVIDAFIYGYEQGARFIDPEVTVEVIYAGVWDDPVRGKQAAKQLFSRGADVIFQIASLTGSGVLEAAAEEGRYAIGVDSNQNAIQPGAVITSNLKHVGDAIYDVYATIAAGTFKPGAVLEYGLAKKGVGLAIDEHTEAILPVASIEKLSEIEADIIAGAIEVKRY